MWWGCSPTLDIQFEVNKSNRHCPSDYLEVLIVGAGDARHIVKTLASSYLHRDRTVTYHVIESTLEQVARSILLLSICLEKNLGLQEATRYYLEILGNTLVRSATAKYLLKHCNRLANISVNTINCPWLNLEKLKHKDRDQLEAIFKFWERATRENVPVVDYWDQRVRNALKTRYDYRDGAFDWDYHMTMKARGVLNLTVQEYRFWRNCGIAFTWLEGEPVRSNPTLLSNIVQHGPGFIHYAYLGDITNGPFFTWALEETKESDKKLRATDIAEQEVMRSIYEIRKKEAFSEDLVASHRDSSILNGTLVTEMPNNKMERELWKKEKSESQKEDIVWVDTQNHKVIFHPATSLETFKSKAEHGGKFDFMWVAHNMIKQLPDLTPLLRKGAIVLTELRKYLAELREEDLQNSVTELQSIARESGLQEIHDIDINDHCIARFYKK